MSETQQPLRSRQDSDEITFKDLVNTVRGLLAHWPVIGACVVLGVSAAFVVNRYTEDRFEVRATVAVEEVENPLASAEGMLNLAFSWGGNGIVDTRIAVLNSYAHNVRVAQNLGWGVACYNKGRADGRWRVSQASRVPSRR